MPRFGGAFFLWKNPVADKIAAIFTLNGRQKCRQKFFREMQGFVCSHIRLKGEKDFVHHA